jgi:hypothetical protein
MIRINNKPHETVEMFRGEIQLDQLYTFVVAKHINGVVRYSIERLFDPNGNTMDIQLHPTPQTDFITATILANLEKGSVEWCASKPMLTDSAFTYWVIEGLLNGQIIYWTGNLPHLSIQQSEAGLPMWTTNIHQAKKMKSKEEADKNSEDFQIMGEVTEHMDV